MYIAPKNVSTTDFNADTYLKLRAQRLAGQTGEPVHRKATEPETSSQSSADSYSANYLKLREQRLADQAATPQTQGAPSSTDLQKNAQKQPNTVTSAVFTETMADAKNVARLNAEKEAQKARQEYEDAKSKEQYSGHAALVNMAAAAQPGSTHNLPQQEQESDELRTLRETAEAAEKKAQRAQQDYRLSQDQKTYEQDMQKIRSLSADTQASLDTYARLNSLARNSVMQNQYISAQRALRQAGLTDEEMDALAETWARMENAETMAQKQQEYAQAAEENPLLHNVLSVPAGIAGAISGTGAVLSEAVDRMDGSRYSILDPNLPGYTPGVYTGTVRQTTTENIDDGTVLGKAGATLYGATMSATDNLARIVTLGPTGALALAGMSSFQDSVREVTQRGGTPAQAYAMGVATAGLEVLTEKVSVDSLISTKTPESITQLLKNAAIQGGIEVSEEELNFAGGLIADAVIMGGNSEFDSTVADLIAGGMSAEEAKRQALTNNLNQAVNVAAQSFLSGGIMSGAQSGFQTMVNGGFSSHQTAPAPAEESTPAPAPNTAQTPQAAPAQTVQTILQTQDTTEDIAQKNAQEIAESVWEGLEQKNNDQASNPQPQLPQYVAPDGLRYEDMTPAQQMAADLEMALENLKKRQAQTAPVENVEIQSAAPVSVDATVPGLYNQNQNNAPLIAEERGNYAAGEMDNRGDRRVSPLYPGEQTAPGAAAGTSNDPGVYQQGYTQGTGGANVYRRDSEGRAVTPDSSARIQDTDPAGRIKQSRLYENTYANATSDTVRKIGEAAQAYDPEVGAYNPISEAETVKGAMERLRTEEDIDAQYQQLLDSEGWTATDNDTAFVVLAALQRAGKTEELVNLARKQRSQATQGGQLIQSFAKYSRTTTGAAVEAIDTVEQYQPYNVANRFLKHKDFSTWKKNVQEAIVDMANQIDNVPEGDVDSMRNIIRSLANFRRTTAWFGNTSRLTAVADAMVNKLDFQTAKEIAIAQLSRIPDDFRQRSTGEILKTIRIQNMLSSLTTVNRNLVGNGAMALVDGFSDSTIGAALDHLVSKVTNRREVSADIMRPKAFMNAATEAAQMAALCAELDVPMDTQAKYPTGRTRTFSPNAGVVSRFFSAYEKYLKYGLEVTDSFFEGGAEATVRASLKKLGAAANLSDGDLHSIARQTAARRTFKDNRKLTRAARKAKDAMNEIGTDDIGLGDFMIPFASVGSNVTHTAIDYSTGGLGGLYEIFTLMRDAKAGKPIEPGRQRKAVTDAARGITGLGLISVFAALASQGVLLVSNDKDWDKRGLEQAEGLTGSQLNLSAAIRALEGKDTAYQQGDILLGVDFMEPFNAQMRIGYLLSQEDSFADMLQAYPGAAVSGVAQALLDSPLMEGLSDVVDLVDGAIESAAAQEPTALVDAAGQLLGTTASGFIPAPVRQAAQIIDPFYRDTTGGNALEKAANQAIAQIPFASMTLPKKYSGLGEEQRRYAEGAELFAFFNTFIAPGKITQASPSEISGYLNELSEATGDVAIYPDYLAPKSFTFDGKTVVISGQEMTETYQRTYGENISRIYSDLIATEGFTELPDETQVAAIKKAKQYATDLAKKAVSDYSKAWMEKANGNEAELIIADIVPTEQDSEQELSGLTEAKYNAASEAGMTLESMQYVSDTFGKLKPETGYSSVRPIQEYEAIIQSPSFNDDQEEAWLKVLFDDKMDQKLDAARDMGYTSEMFVQAYRAYLDNNSRKADTVQYIQEKFGVSKEEAEALYKLYKGTK